MHQKCIKNDTFTTKINVGEIKLIVLFELIGSTSDHQVIAQDRYDIF